MKVNILRYLPDDYPEDRAEGKVMEDTDEYVSVTLCEAIFYETADGRVTIQNDHRVDGEVWQVHKTDADPFPSSLMPIA